MVKRSSPLIGQLYTPLILPAKSGFFGRFGGKPAWVPTDAVNAWDFANDRYYGEYGFSRASAGYRMNASGVLVSVAADVPRIEYSPALARLGLILEPARTNLLPQSEALNVSWTLTNASTAANVAVAPDGETSPGRADRLTDNAVNNNHLLMQSLAFTSGLTYTFSTCLKADVHSWAQITLSTSMVAGGPWFNVNLATGAIGNFGGTGGIDRGVYDLGNGWYRAWLIANATASATASSGVIILTANSNTGTRVPSYVGAGNGFFVWGSQLEVGNGMSSYIQNYGATNTREADVLTLELGGTRDLTVTFDDNSTQAINGVSGDYAIVPANLNRRVVKQIVSKLAA